MQMVELLYPIELADEPWTGLSLYPENMTWSPVDKRFAYYRYFFDSTNSGIFMAIEGVNNIQKLTDRVDSNTLFLASGWVGYRIRKGPHSFRPR